LVHKTEASTGVDRVKTNRCIVEEIGELGPLVADSRLELVTRSDVSDVPEAVSRIPGNWVSPDLEVAAIGSRQFAQTQSSRCTGSSYGVAEPAKLLPRFPVVAYGLLNPIEHRSGRIGEEPIEDAVGIANAPFWRDN
jgi:hypothetical protein